MSSQSKRCFFISLASALMLTCIAAPQDAMGDLAITNGDFEDDFSGDGTQFADNTNNVTNWFDTIGASTPGTWFAATWSGAFVSPNGTSVLGLSFQGEVTNWAYQSLGVNTDGLTSLDLTFDLGSFTDADGFAPGGRDMGLTLSVYSVNGSYGGGADDADIALDANATLLDSATVTTGGPIFAGDLLINQMVSLNISGSTITDELYLRLENVTGSTYTVGNQNGGPWLAVDNLHLPLSLTAIEWDDEALDGSYNNGTNWDGDAVPGADADVLFGSAITANRTVTVDTGGDVQLNSMIFDAGAIGDYYLVADTVERLLLSGTDGSGGEALIFVNSGRDWLQMELDDTAGQGIEKTGSGELILDAANTFSGDLSVADGRVSVLNTGAIPSGANIELTDASSELLLAGTTAGFFADNGALSSGYVGGTIDGVISGAGNVLVVLDSSVTFTGANTYTGNTTVGDAFGPGSLTLASTGELTFDINDDNDSNSILGVGTVDLDGTVKLDVTDVTDPVGAWLLVDVANLTETFNTNFGVEFAAGGAFGESGGIWTNGSYAFNEATGYLSFGDVWIVDADGTYSTGSNWNSTVAPAGNTDVLFSDVISENRTVTLNNSGGAVQVNSLVFDNEFGVGDYYLVADTTESIEISGAAGEINVVAGRHWIQVPIEDSATQGLTMTGADDAELILDAANTYDGDTAIGTGRLSVLNAGAIPAGSNVSIAAGGELVLSGGTVFFVDNGMVSGGYIGGTIDGVISGDGTVFVAGGADATFTGANTLTGPIQVQEVSSLTISGSGTLGDTTGATTVLGQSTLTLDGVSVGDEALFIDDESQLALDGATLGTTPGGALISLDENADGETPKITSTGASTINHNIFASVDDAGSFYEIESQTGSTLTLSGTLATDDGAAPNDRFFVFSGDGNIDVTGRITDALTLADGSIAAPSANVNAHVIKRGGGILSIEAGTTDVNDFWLGTTTVEAGTLAVQNGGGDAGELRSSNLDVRENAVLDVSSFGTYSLQIVDDPDTVPFNGDEIGQIVTGAGTINTGAGTLSAFEDAVFAPGDSGAGTLNVTGNLSINQTVANPNGGLNYELSDSAGGTNDQIAVTGNLDLDADAAAGGPQFKLNVTVIDANLDSASPYTLMTAGNTTGSTATPADFDITILNPQGTVLNTRQDDGAAVTIGGTSVTVTFSAAESHNWTGASDGNWDIAATTNWSSSDNLYYDLDTVTFGDGTGQTTVDIAAAVTPGGANFTNNADTYTFTGAGIEGGGDVSLAAGANVILNNDGNNITGDVSLGAGSSLTAGDGNTTGTTLLLGEVSGAGPITLNSGTLQLSGDNSSYTGAVTVNDGELNMDSATALGDTGTGTLVNGGRLRSFNDAYTTSEPITLDAGELSVGGGDPAALTLAGAVTVNAGGGAFQLDTNGGVDALTVTSDIGGAAAGAINADIGANSTMTVTGNITNNGDLNKTGTGTLAIGATTTVASPNINVEAGTLDVSSQAPFTLAGGQTLNNNSNNTVVGDVTAASGSTVAGRGTFANNVTVQSGATLRVGEASLPMVSTLSVTNGDFETNPPGDFNPDVAAPWFDFDGGAGFFANAWSLIGASYNGTQLLALSAYSADTTVDGAGLNGYAYQSIGADAGATALTVTFDMGSFTDAGAGNNRDLGVTISILESDGSFVPDENTDILGASGITLIDQQNVLLTAVAPGTSSNQMFSFDLSGGGLAAQTGGELFFRINNYESVAGAVSNPPLNDQGQSWVGVDNITLLASGAGGAFAGETMTVAGDLTLDAGSTLALGIAGSGVNDLLAVTGNLAAGGTLDVTLGTGAPTPQLGDAFDILDFGSASSAFDTLNLPDLTGGLNVPVWDTSQLLVTGILSVIRAPGDADFDGDVDLDDYNILSGNMYTNVAGGYDDGDFDEDGDVDFEDFVVQALNFGDWPSADETIGDLVPEPASMLMMLMGAGLLIRRRSR